MSYFPKFRARNIEKDNQTYRLEIFRYQNSHRPFNRIITSKTLFLREKIDAKVLSIESANDRENFPSGIP